MPVFVCTFKPMFSLEYLVRGIGKRANKDSQRWKRVWIKEDCTEDSLTANECKEENIETLCWFKLEKVTDGRDTDGQFLKAVTDTETRLSRK